MLLTMAFRNLWRSKRRTGITLLSVAFGVWLAVTFTGMGDYTYTNMLDTGARMGFGHVTVQSAGYLDSPGLDRRMRGVSEILDRVSKTPNVEGAIVRMTGQVMLSSAAKSVGGMFFGIDPKKESTEHNALLRGMTDGHVFERANGRGIVVGRLLADKMNLRIGKRVVYTMVDVEGKIVSDVARVSGVYETGSDDIDGALVLLPIDTVRRLLRYAEDEATVVAVFLSDHRRSSEVQANLSAQLSADQEVVTYRDTQPELAGFIEIDRATNYFFQILVALLIGAGVLNTILMSVLERRRELGVMMAIGTLPRQLFGLVFIESVLVGGLGLVLGTIMTAPWYAYLHRVGIDFGDVYGDTTIGGILVDPVIRLELYPESAFAIGVGVFVVTVVAGLYPAWQAGREPPVETLKTL